jgi:ring-1,2-phenylacetyl-CoA epoxidase subunit PaaD
MVTDATRTAAYAAAAGTPDPELPLVTIADLGILRSVEVTDDGVVATITPTYSGCPAIREITADLRQRLAGAGFGSVTIRTLLAPAWTSDWITPDGRRKLAKAGIAPPLPAPGHLLDNPRGPVPLTLGRRPSPRCPRCGSADTQLTAEFGATSCKSLHRCTSCGEPFEAVKPL